MRLQIGGKLFKTKIKSKAGVVVNEKGLIEERKTDKLIRREKVIIRGTEEVLIGVTEEVVIRGTEEISLI